jgi:hypothetical protein
MLRQQDTPVGAIHPAHSLDILSWVEMLRLPACLFLSLRPSAACANSIGVIDHTQNTGTTVVRMQ